MKININNFLKSLQSQAQKAMNGLELYKKNNKEYLLKEVEDDLTVILENLEIVVDNIIEE